MMKLRLAASSAIAALALSACGPNEPAATSLAACGGNDVPAAAQTGPGLSIQPLQFTCKKLENGLRVYAMPDSNTASVSVARKPYRSPIGKYHCCSSVGTSPTSRDSACRCDFSNLRTWMTLAPSDLSQGRTLSGRGGGAAGARAGRRDFIGAIVSVAGGAALGRLP
ncbi:MAG TPA: hypothetical protein PLN33_04740 [Hyphomonadaceae bacterium]|nr:hypothetical protein [Hyphomonadaceae bacterium]